MNDRPAVDPVATALGNLLMNIGENIYFNGNQTSTGLIVLPFHIGKGAANGPHQDDTQTNSSFQNHRNDDHDDFDTHIPSSPQINNDSSFQRNKLVFDVFVIRYV